MARYACANSTLLTTSLVKSFWEITLALMKTTIAPNATAEELERLAQTNEPNICQEVAKHPNSPPDLLKKLFHHYYREVLENPALELILLENPLFLSELDGTTGEDRFKTEPLPLFCYELAINSPELWYREAIALNSHTPINILEKLIRDNDMRVCAAVGLNRNFPVERLEKIVCSYSDSKLADFIEAIEDIREDYFYSCKLDSFYYDLALHFNEKNETEDVDAIFVWLWGQIAHNSFTPIDILEKLATNKNPYARAGVAGNPNTPLSVLEKLALDDNEDVILSLTYNNKISNAIEIKKVKEKYHTVLINLSSNPKTPYQELHLLAKNKSPEIRSAVAKNSNTRGFTLEKLAEDANNLIALDVAQNINTPLKVLEKLAQHNNESVRRLASFQAQRHLDCKARNVSPYRNL